MKKNVFFVVFLLATSVVFAQYTDIINSNNPGKSMGAYGVGRKVAQVESEFFFEQSHHNLLYYGQTNWGVNYEIRYGIWREKLELLLDGTLLYDQWKVRPGNESINTLGFYKNTLGAKYLLYEPTFQDKVNLYSWKANALFNWKKLIPAVSLYLGANFFAQNRFLYELFNQNNPIITPKAVVSLQSHPSRNIVLVANIIADNFIANNRQWGYIVTLTHNLNNERWSVFFENEGVNSFYYTDALARMGFSFLISKDLQVNAFAGMSFKNTPTRYSLATGISYRFYDKHKDIEFREKMKAREKENQKDAQIFNFK